jgi:transcriptional regulator with XRE-family HTH domain
MSPRKQPRSSSDAVDTAVTRVWIAFGLQVHDARLARRWSVEDLAQRAGLSSGFVYMVEAGRSGSIEAAVRLAGAFGWRTQLELTDPRRRERPRAELSDDPVHSAMGELEAAHLRRLGFPVGINEPYQHHHFAGRADLVAWDLERDAVIHLENRTRFPNFQDMAGAFNSKRAYLGAAIGQRVGVRRWRSETHVIAALWSAEVLHSLRLRAESFRAICPDPPRGFAGWWQGEPPPSGASSELIVIDPLATSRQRTWIGLDEAMTVRPRHRGYADLARLLETAPR